MTKKREIPLFYYNPFIDRMDAFFREYKMFDDPIKELEGFWKEFKFQVYEAYRDADNWHKFKEVIEILLDGGQS